MQTRLLVMIPPPKMIELAGASRPIEFAADTVYSCDGSLSTQVMQRETRCRDGPLAGRPLERSRAIELHTGAAVNEPVEINSAAAGWRDLIS